MEIHVRWYLFIGITVDDLIQKQIVRRIIILLT